MANLGRFDFSQLVQLQNKLQRLQNPDEFIDKCAKELAARLLERVIDRTQPGDYSQNEDDKKNNKKDNENDDENDDKNNGKNGGTLRRGWTSKTYAEAAEGSGDGKDPGQWADSLPIKQYGNTICIQVSNPVEYASYVEYGHRQTPGRYVPAIGKKLKRSWVPGKFMLKISSDEVQALAPALLEDKIKNFLKELF